ncbi:uncharacterized protein LOC27207676 [Drosophila simulans]|uniref:uncharacterized protein LOC27207676 n=1 Tax=Drosophila simulans TaxID=7240 RepID=UPI00078AE617|nr:uncharacterized protein LOC27207676 [Drosophila simulans]KMZ02016.1 uncharacterized protein Dsimw501_GD27827, isoform A [Drosophila simulans]
MILKRKVHLSSRLFRFTNISSSFLYCTRWSTRGIDLQIIFAPIKPRSSGHLTQLQGWTITARGIASHSDPAIKELNLKFKPFLLEAATATFPVPFLSPDPGCTDEKNIFFCPSGCEARTESDQGAGATAGAVARTTAGQIIFTNYTLTCQLQKERQTEIEEAKNYIKEARGSNRAISLEKRQ